MNFRSDGESPSGHQTIEFCSSRFWLLPRPQAAARYFCTCSMCNGLRPRTSAHLTVSLFSIVPVFHLLRRDLAYFYAQIGCYMDHIGLWKHCTTEHCKEMILSFELFGVVDWPEEKQIACLYAVSNHVEKHYHPALIPKRDGSSRQLLVPDSILKRIQTNILYHILESMPVSSYATAYQKGKGLTENAKVHVGRRQVLKLDITDFFGSILFPRVRRSVFSEVYFPPAVGTLLTSLCCYKDYLPQGAPTSPAISNLVMKPFDDFMGAWCGERGIGYTRYCDDMTFSGDFDAELVTHKVRNFLEAMGFTLNEKKTKVLNRAKRQAVTGIVVNCRAQVSRDYRRRLRQEIYYCGRFGVKSHLARIKDHRYGLLGPEGRERYMMTLLGKVNFILQVNPEDKEFQKARQQVKMMMRGKGRPSKR